MKCKASSYQAESKFCACFEQQKELPKYQLWRRRTPVREIILELRKAGCHTKSQSSPDR